MTSTCKFCGNELDDEYNCETCNCYYEERMNFTGYVFSFIEDVKKERKFKTLPFPTKEERCENCAFKLHVTEKYVNYKTGEPSKHVPDYEHGACYLLPCFYSYDTNSVHHIMVKNTSTCKRFKKRKKELKTQVITIIQYDFQNEGKIMNESNARVVMESKDL